MNAATTPEGPPGAPGSGRHLAWLFAPRTLRAPLAALFTIESEILGSARPGIEHTVAHARLAWWLEEATQLAAGKPRHPLGKGLAAATLAAGLSPPDLRDLVEIARLDLASTAFESRPEYAEYLARWGRGLFRGFALLQAPDPAARADVERFCSVAGPALRDVELVASLASDARLGRVHAAESPASYAAWQQQPWPEPQAAQLRARLDERHMALRRAATGLQPALRPALRAALAWCAQAEQLARRCVAALPLQYDAGRLDALAATWTAWRAAVAAGHGRLPRALEENG